MDLDWTGADSRKAIAILLGVAAFIVGLPLVRALQFGRELGMRRFAAVLALGAVAAPGAALAAAPANQMCPQSSDQLGQRLNALTKTSEVDRYGLILRTHSGTGMKMLGVTPVTIQSNWVEGTPVAAEFSLPGSWEKYASAFRASFGQGQAKCDDECRWVDGAAAAGALKSATLFNELVVHTATVRCEYN